MKINPITRAVKAALFTGAALSVAVPVTYAQTDEALEEVVVTGSRIKRDGFDSVSPVSVTSAEDIKVSGQTRIEDLLNQLPQIEAAQTSFISNGASGTASLDLRGLGAIRTLVLVNGRRIQAGNFATSAPDINQIPSALVERIEVLTGGASATYGADAVAGVVNFIMKKDFEGLEFTAGGSAFQHDNSNGYLQGLMDARNFSYPDGGSGLDGKAYSLDLTMGSSFADGKGHAVVYATKRNNDELRQEARDYSSCALNNAGTACGGSANADVPNFFIGDVGADGVQNNYIFASIDPTTGGFVNDDGSNRYNFAPINHFMRPDTRYSIGAFVDYEVNDYINPFMEVMYTSDRTRAQIAESGTFFAEQYNMDIDHPLIPQVMRDELLAQFPAIRAPGQYQDVVSVYIGKRNVEGGPRTNILESNATRIVLGTEGKLSENWDYNASYAHGQTSSSSTYINDFFAPRIAIAVDSGIIDPVAQPLDTSAFPGSCANTAGCLPYNVFVLNGVTAAQAANLTGTGILNGQIEQDVFSAFVSGDLNIGLPSAGGDNVQVVVGLENRRDLFESQSDEVFEQGLLLGQGGPTATVGGVIEATDYFGEMHVPVLTGNMDLSVDVAYRFSDYTAKGNGLNSGFDNSTYKFGVEFQPIDMVRIRAGFNRAERVPNVGELFSAQTLGLWNGTDPCGGVVANGETPQLSAAQCANTGVTAAQYGTIALSPASQYNGQFGGNQQLQSELADTITFGAVFQPLDNLKVSVDYWDIEMEDVIGTISAELTVEQCALTGSATFCNNVTRNAAGSLWRGTNGFVTATNLNLAGRHFEGIDLAVSYDVDLFGGSVAASLVGTVMMTKEYDPVPGLASAKYDCVGDISVQCFATPDWRHTAAITYDRGGPWAVNGKWRYLSNVHYYDGVDQIADSALDATSYFDLSGSYDINESISVFAGVTNILDEEVPMVGGTLQSNGNAPNGNYDPLGRYLYGSVTFKY